MFEQTHGQQLIVNLPESNNITALAYYEEVYSMKSQHVLLDVRSSVQFDMINLCRINSKIEIAGNDKALSYKNIPLYILQKMTRPEISCQLSVDGEEVDVYIVCRGGVDSMLAAKFLLDKGRTNVKNIEGGLNAWHHNVDPSFPFY